ncbi:MAG: penicillin-binding protein transpeptidase [Gemmatimonadetes bacterium]|nr:penicillin-binding protein transpeptidase [Gemmatimonadota bacterium]
MIRSSRIGIVHLTLAVFAIALLVRAARVQIVQGREWADRAAHQHVSEREVPAPRGQILDATGAVLAESHDMVQLAIAPKEVTKPAQLRRALTRAAYPREWVARALDAKRAWVVLPGRRLSVDVADAVALRGVHATPFVERSYSMSEGTRRIVGRVTPDGAPLDGVELALDSIIRGEKGSSQLMKDVRGRTSSSPTQPGIAARSGHTVVLTINHELQEIAERSLDEATQQMSAEGGDIVIMDPHDGSVLAMASHRQDPRSTSATALTEPFEPGSTLKPFIASGLLARQLVTDADEVDTYGGVYTINGRTIHDVHKGGRMTLADVLTWSSNVGIVQFASRLTPRDQYETLRDFGFGTPTGLQYPTESSGRLHPPAEWSLQSPQSIAIGYEISVTPLQLVTAYAAIANGGELLQPSLVKEVRDPDGTVIYRHSRRVVRRVISPEVASRMRGMLRRVVDNGTALKADLADFTLGGKTGTARRTVNGHYAPDQYIPTFVGLFPAEDPQYVILVKLDNPKGAYYGGTTAAPLTKVVLQAAIAARDAALDRSRLTRVAQAGRSAPVTRDTLSPEPGRHEAGSVPFVVQLPAPPPRVMALQPPRAVPDVHGLALRDAVRSLHAAGFRVELARGPEGSTAPEAGALATPGTLVRLLYER